MTEAFEPNTDELVANNDAFVADFGDADLSSPPTRHVAVVACMDARMDVHKILGLNNGEAHIIRNAGGVLSADAIRSLCLSQRALGTREIILLHHTRCGLQGIDEAAFYAEVEADTGVKPDWPLHSFDEPEDDVGQAMAQLLASPFIPFTDHVRGFVYDVDDGRLHEVERQAEPSTGRP